MTDDQRAAVLAYIEAHPGCGLRPAAESVGLYRCHLRAEIDGDPEFAAEYRTARGYGADEIRQEIRLRAFDRDDPGSVKFLAMMARAYCPEHRERQAIELSGEVRTTDAIDAEIAALMAEFAPRSEGPAAGRATSETVALRPAEVRRPAARGLGLAPRPNGSAPSAG